MKICILSYEYEPFPGGGIATYHNAAARILADAGHDVHVVTNRARHGRPEERFAARRWTEGSLTVHRLDYFDDRREVRANVQFLDVCPDRYAPREKSWAADPSNIAAIRAAAYVEHLHAEVGLDVVESPEFFAEAYYILRARKSGRSARFPPVCVHGHISSRLAFEANQHVWELGYHPHRQMMLREEYCVQEADALLTPSRALMRRYETVFAGRLPQVRRTIPYFLELPAGSDEVPAALRAGWPYLVCIGRIEPRKGSDLAMRAFAALAERHRDLRLVFLGKEMWHQGESVDDVVAMHVPERHRQRVLRLGNVPREQALAAARHALAFLHPAPWDNYPCAVLEAMRVGAACVVSDQGGQAEMVEHGVSGLVFPAEDPTALVGAIERLVADEQLARNMRVRAAAAAQRITEPRALVAAKIELYEAMLAAPDRVRDPAARPREVEAPRPMAPLPGRGVVLLDVGDRDEWVTQSSLESLRSELAASPDWRLLVLLDAGRKFAVAEGADVVSTIAPPPWTGMAPDEVFVHVLAGTRFDDGRLREMVRQVLDSRVGCGSFVWLRPPDARVFPYASDLGWQDLLALDRVLPPALAVRAGALARLRSFAGLLRPHHRLGACMAVASAGANLLLQHTGEVSGDHYRDLPVMDRDTQFRVLGALDLCGVAPPACTAIGSLELPPIATAATAPPMSAASTNAGAGAEPVRVEVRVVPPADYVDLQRVYAEHMALKQHWLVRTLRRVRVFDLVRALFPKSKRALGSGR